MKKSLFFALILTVFGVANVFAATNGLIASVYHENSGVPEGSSTDLFKYGSVCLIEVGYYGESGNFKTQYVFSGNKLLSAQNVTTTYANYIFIEPDNELYDPDGKDVYETEVLDLNNRQVRRDFQKEKSRFSSRQLSRCRG